MEEKLRHAIHVKRKEKGQKCRKDMGESKDWVSRAGDGHRDRIRGLKEKKEEDGPSKLNMESEELLKRRILTRQ